MKLLSNNFISLFIILVCCLLQKCCLTQTTTVRPYKFGFTIDEQQHRSEQRDERGIVMGEFGFITADGIYHVTVYATDEEGRFRILAMKNYPYESPPKTVEVMVQPKLPPKTTTTTTAKTLPSHNFNQEACSGCFLTNGNNKPKGLNGLEGKSVKSDIKPLSKTLPNAKSGKIVDANIASLISPAKLPHNLLSTPLISKVTIKDLNELKHAVKNQNFNYAPRASKSTNTAQHTENAETQIFNFKPLTLTHKQISTNIAKQQDMQAANKQEVKMNPLIFTPKFVANVVAKAVTQSLAIKDIVKSKVLYEANLKQKILTLPNKRVKTNVAINPEQSRNNIIKIFETPLKIQQQLFNTKNPQLHNAPLPPHNQILHQTLLNLINNDDKLSDNYNIDLLTDKHKRIVNNVPNLTKSISFLKQDLPTRDNSLSQTPVITSPQLQVESAENLSLQNSLETLLDQKTPGDVLQNPAVAQPTSLNQNPPKPIKQNTINTKYTSTSTTGQKTQEQLLPRNTNHLQTTYTANPTIAATSQPKQVTGNSPGFATTATKTNTGNPPPIMDIIMQKVLPALMGKKGQQKPSTINTPNNKPNAVENNNIPNIGISGSIPNKKFGGGNNSGSSSLNGDGDLYRFKYILDFHGHSETGKRNGNKQGTYFSIGDDDVERTIEYVANEFGYQPRIRWRKLDRNEIPKSKENTLKDYEFIWFK